MNRSALRLGKFGFQKTQIFLADFKTVEILATFLQVSKSSSILHFMIPLLKCCESEGEVSTFSNWSCSKCRSKCVLEFNFASISWSSSPFSNKMSKLLYFGLCCIYCIPCTCTMYAPKSKWTNTSFWLAHVNCYYPRIVSLHRLQWKTLVYWRFDFHVMEP